MSKYTDELREKIVRSLESEDKGSILTEGALSNLVELIKTEQSKLLDRLDSVNVTKSCVENCTELEHAEHEGGYRHYQRIESAIDEEREVLTGGDQ